MMRRSGFLFRCSEGILVLVILDLAESSVTKEKRENELMFCNDDSPATFHISPPTIRMMLCHVTQIMGGNGKTEKRDA